MDKQAMKAAFAAAGLPQVPYLNLVSDDLRNPLGAAPPEALLERIERVLGYPCFVKPANLGSSVGISKATDRASLLAGLQAAAALDPRLVIEQGVTARELECAVRGGGHRLHEVTTWAGGLHGNAGGRRWASSGSSSGPCWPR
jgi:D-alanine-D-alanine ligase